MNNPMAALSAMLIFGAWLGAILPFGYFMFIAIVLIIAMVFKLIRFGMPYKSFSFIFILMIIITFAAGLSATQYVRKYNLSRSAPFAHEQVKIFGEVLEIQTWDTGSAAKLYIYRLEHNNIDYKPRTKMNLIIYGSGFEAEIRDIIVVQGKLELYKPMGFWGETSRRSSNASKGVFAKIIANPTDIEIIGSNKRPVDLLVWGDNARKHINKVVDKYLSGDEAALMKGILIGNKNDFSSELYDTFRKSGILHIVAVSGLHVSIFIIFISFGVLSFTTNRKLKSFLLLCTIFAYTVIVGGQPSILRAALMAGYGILLENSKLRRDSLTALMVSTALLTLINPYLLHNIGFQLSFMATLGIILFQGKIIKYTVANAAAAAFLFTAPILAYSFNTITFASLFTNLLISPLVIISLLLGYVMCIVPITGIVLSPILFCICRVMILISKFFASIKFLTISVASPSFSVLICCFAALCVLYQFAIGNIRKKRTVFAATIFISIIILNTFTALSGAKDINVNFAAADSGDGIHVRTPNGYNLLIDAGDGPDIFTYLVKNNIHKIDTVILTNLKAEDTNGVIYLIMNMPVTNIYLPIADESIKAFADKKGINTKYYKQGESITIDGVRFDVLMHDMYAKTLNNTSAAIKMTCYNTGVMLLGDFGTDTEQEMLGLYCKETIKSDIVRLANHGAATSNSDALIKAMNAQYAIANSGYNSSEKLSYEVYKNLIAAKTKPLKTYQSGTISFTINKNGIKSIKKARIPIEEDL